MKTWLCLQNKVVQKTRRVPTNIRNGTRRTSGPDVVVIILTDGHQSSRYNLTLIGLLLYLV